MATTTKPLNIVFVHPDLGIGGAERLVIDAAVGLQSLGHKVTILTSYRDPAHCFEEARDGTLDVRVRGDTLFPASLGGRLSILFSILRQFALTITTGVFTAELRQLDPDVFIVDQLSACVPLFRLLRPRAKVLFYGHYPDRLLIKQEFGVLKKLKTLYRIPFDRLEGWSTGCSDSIVVNSKFTKNVFRRTFPSIGRKDLKVIYPCVDTNSTAQSQAVSVLWPDKKVFLSINRFEGKKNLDLAVKAFAGLPATERSTAKLVLAGGYDPRNQENAECHQHLQDLSSSLNLTHATFRPQDTAHTDLASEDVDILFLLSIPHELKMRLLQSASLLLYTPENEHFGIVPLEAMLAGVPVLATDTGGPLETIYNDRTGFHRSPDKVEQWTAVMRKPLIPSSVDGLKAMGQRGRDRVLAEFSQTKMTGAFDQEIQRLVRDAAPRPTILPSWAAAMGFIVLVAVLASLIHWLVFRSSFASMPQGDRLRSREPSASGMVETIAAR